MILLTSIQNFKENYLPDDYKVFLVVRSIEALIKQNNSVLGYAQQLSVLSPSEDLFTKYLHLLSKGLWNMGSFNTEYAPQFNQEMEAEAPQRWLDYLAELSQTTDIALLCYCKNQNLCHRKLLADILLNKGAEVSLL